MAGKYFCEECGTEMDLSISDICPVCAKKAGPSKAGTSKVSATESYHDKATFGLDENVASALCYVLGWLTGIIFILVEKDNKVVRFHAMQSILTFISLGILGWIVGLMTIGSYSYGVWAAVGTVIVIIEIILWVLLIYKAYQGETYELPIVGSIAAKQLE
jgi:uncharacterized membrane protein